MAQEAKATEEKSVFSTKYSEFAEDLLGTLPEYTSQIKLAKILVILLQSYDNAKEYWTYETNLIFKRAIIVYII